MQRSGQLLGAHDTRSSIGAGTLLYFSPCLGIPPMLIVSPQKFFGIQGCAGLMACAGLFLFEMLR